MGHLGRCPAVYVGVRRIYAQRRGGDCARFNSYGDGRPKRGQTRLSGDHAVRLLPLPRYVLLLSHSRLLHWIRLRSAFQTHRLEVR